MPRFRLRSILLAVHLFVLIIPLGSIYFFRLYENELIRQTEAELIAQGAYVAAHYKQALLPLIAAHPAYGTAATVTAPRSDEKYTVVAPTLDLANAEIYPRRPLAETSSQKPDSLALQAGKIIFPVLEEATLTTLAGVRITDYRGIVVAGRDETGLSLAHIAEVAAALRGKHASVLRERISDTPPPPLASISRGAGLRVFVAMPIIQNDRVLGSVLLSRSPRNMLKGLYDARESVFVAGGIILGIAVFLALLTSYAISRPIYALIAQTQRVARNEKNIAPIEEPITQELALLSQNIAAMAQTIAERSDYIRNFSMHVSHEFKTPLTSIQGAIELIQEHGSAMPPEQFQKFLNNIIKDTDRLKMLVSRLMELARADVMEPTRETCFLQGVVEQLQSDYQNQITITAEHAGGIRLPVPADILRTVLSTLIENSRQHGATTVHIRTCMQPGKTEISVADNGPGISPANAPQLFTPFFTTKRHTGGTGLGLVIIRSLLGAYHATIRHEHSAQGAHFIVGFDLPDYTGSIGTDLRSGPIAT